MDWYNVHINIYSDLCKAFATLDHSILLSKLKYYGITGSLYDFLSSYLISRSQYVEFSGHTSDTLPLSPVAVVPQGSVLDLLLFIAYISDLPVVSNIYLACQCMLMIRLYIITSIETYLLRYLTEISLKINQCLGAIKLSINVSKTKFMVFIPTTVRFHTLISKLMAIKSNV